jgi:hypothetical protein
VTFVLFSFKKNLEGGVKLREIKNKEGLRPFHDGPIKQKPAPIFVLVAKKLSAIWTNIIL